MAPGLPAGSACHTQTLLEDTQTSLSLCNMNPRVWNANAFLKQICLQKPWGPTLGRVHTQTALLTWPQWYSPLPHALPSPLACQQGSLCPVLC